MGDRGMKGFGFEGERWRRTRKTEAVPGGDLTKILFSSCDVSSGWKRWGKLETRGATRRLSFRIEILKYLGNQISVLPTRLPDGPDDLLSRLTPKLARLDSSLSSPSSSGLNIAASLPLIR